MKNTEITNEEYDTYHGINFYKNQTYPLSTIKDDEILIKKGKYKFGKIKRNEFINLLNSRKRQNKSILEVIMTHRPRRAYFDIDGKQENALSVAKEAIKKVFGEDIEMSISGSQAIKWRREKKNGCLVRTKGDKLTYSYHIVLPNIVFGNLDEMKGFKAWVETEGFADNKVYTANRAMKAIYQFKEYDNPERKQNIIENNDEEKHIISLLPDAEYDKIDESILEKLQNYVVQKPDEISVDHKRTVERKTEAREKKQARIKGKENRIRFQRIPGLHLPKHINLREQTPKELLMLVPNLKDDDYKLGRELHFQIMTFASHNDVS